MVHKGFDREETGCRGSNDGELEGGERGLRERAREAAVVAHRVLVVGVHDALWYGSY